MSNQDWASLKALDLVDDYFREPLGTDSAVVRGIAQALRAARDEGIEAGAKVVFTTMLDANQNGFMGAAIGLGEMLNTIRNLKSEDMTQNQGSNTNV